MAVETQVREGGRDFIRDIVQADLEDGVVRAGGVWRSGCGGVRPVGRRTRRCGVRGRSRACPEPAPRSARVASDEQGRDRPEAHRTRLTPAELRRFLHAA